MALEEGSAKMAEAIDPKAMKGMIIVSSRVFDWPREAVFGAFSNPEILKQWWGPDGFSSTFHAFEFRAGGEWRFILHGPDGTDYDNASDFIEIVNPSRITFYHHGPMHAFYMTMDYAEKDGKTELTWNLASESGEENPQMRAFFEAAAEQNYDRLEAALRKADSTGREIVISRLINAPPALVFQMFTDPVHINKWWGPDGFSNTTHEMQFRVGGVWRHTMHGPDGTDYPNRIRYSEIIPDKRLAYDHDSDDDNDLSQAFKAVITFEEKNGKTLVAMRLICRSPEQLEEFRKFGAFEGGEQTLARLSAYLATVEAS
jgi:uncharacterized protein YndB with AHSA1/START domain